MAAISGHLDVVNLLLSKNTASNFQSAGSTWLAVHSAAYRGHFDIVCAILSADGYEVPDVDIDLIIATSTFPDEENENLITFVNHLIANHPIGRHFREALANIFIESGRFDKATEVLESLLTSKQTDKDERHINDLIHAYIVCDLCKERGDNKTNNIRGYRIKCKLCPPYFDLCQNCADEETHEHGYENFLEIPSQPWASRYISKLIDLKPAEAVPNVSISPNLIF
jgi:hypothetical protein